MTATTAIVLAAAAPAAGLGGLLGPDMLSTIGFPILLVALFYFMMLRPQQRRAREHADKIKSIKRGDTVVLNNGMLGKVVRVEDVELGIEIAQNVTVKVIKDMVQDVRTRGEPAPANDAKS
ncbi:preprotein translocase subunit YajC [Caulobacter sp. KR2-114]|uniref:preprotein translocase subunit YajC n=1 Tax=Caulobacter sp. KR2-114 TaxID=3400912 RepID=UPI003C0A128F